MAHILNLILERILELVGVLLALIAIYLSWIWRPRKRLDYIVMLSEPILNHAQKHALDDGTLSLVYKDEKLKNPYQVIVKVFNSGNRAIAIADFSEPLTFNMGENAKILQAKFVRSSPKNLRPEIEIKENSILVKPLLLNAKDSFWIDILVSDFDECNSIQAHGRVVGVAEVRNVTEKNWWHKERRLLTNIVLFLNATIGFGLAFATQWGSIYSLSGLALLGLVLLLRKILYINKWII